MSFFNTVSRLFYGDQGEALLAHAVEIGARHADPPPESLRDVVQDAIGMHDDLLTAARNTPMGVVRRGLLEVTQFPTVPVVLAAKRGLKAAEAKITG